MSKHPSDNFPVVKRIGATLEGKTLLPNKYATTAWIYDNVDSTDNFATFRDLDLDTLYTDIPVNAIGIYGILSIACDKLVNNKSGLYQVRKNGETEAGTFTAFFRTSTTKEVGEKFSMFILFDDDNIVEERLSIDGSIVANEVDIAFRRDGFIFQEG